MTCPGKSPHCQTDTSVTPRRMKTYSESRIELQNLQILKKMLVRWSQFLLSEQPVRQKAWTLPWISDQIRISNQFDRVSKTHFSFNTVGRELRLAILCPLLCPQKTDWKMRIGKQVYVFLLTGFKKWCSDVPFLTSISVLTVILRLGKVEFFK